jgi:hypothetical protein
MMPFPRLPVAYIVSHTIFRGAIPKHKSKIVCPILHDAHTIKPAVAYFKKCITLIIVAVPMRANPKFYGALSPIKIPCRGVRQAITGVDRYFLRILPICESHTVWTSHLCLCSAIAVVEVKQ